MATKKIDSPFLCSECGSPLMPLPFRAGTCPNGHGRVRTGLPKIALSWLADQRRRERQAAIVAFIAKKIGNFRRVELDGVRGEFTVHRITDADTGRRRSVPKVGDDLPDGCCIGVSGKQVRMLEPLKEKSK